MAYLCTPLFVVVSEVSATIAVAFLIKSKRALLLLDLSANRLQLMLICCFDEGRDDRSDNE